MKRPFVITVLCLILGITLAACGGGLTGNKSMAPEMDESSADIFPGASGGMSALEPQSAALEAEQSAANAPMSNQSGQPPVERLVIKNADLSMEVSSVRDAESSIRTRVGELGGYIVRVETSGTDSDQMTARITFRVPADRFEEALAGVQGLAQKVHSRSVSGDDVTEEFVDLDARLRNLEATRDRLITLLDQATRVEDALQVNSALSDVQGEIEQIRGRMQYLQRSAALSTVNVYLMPVPVIPIVSAGSWHPLAVARDALRSLIELGQGLINLAIVLLVWTPVWLPLLLVARWIWKRFRQRVRKTTSASTASGTVQG